ncbi:MAG: hypothetical protein OEM81_09805 [Acidimicrobiia bacterium]|nr:hypothetical protein [Acidimicrobiia bacterium]
MLGLRKRPGHIHDDLSYGAGPGLVRMVCSRCRRVSVYPCEAPAPPDSEDILAVDCLAWLAITSA